VEDAAHGHADAACIIRVSSSFIAVVIIVVIVSVSNSNKRLELSSPGKVNCLAWRLVGYRWLLVPPHLRRRTMVIGADEPRGKRQSAAGNDVICRQL